MKWIKLVKRNFLMRRQMKECRVVQIKGRQGKRDNKGNSLGVVVYNCNPST
jgi:hypothetical protein